MSLELHAGVSERLKNIEQRYTSGRRQLVEILDQVGQPISIAQIVASKSSLPQSSIYRNLAVLEQANVVHRVAGSDELVRFELSEELTEHHHHLVCCSCGSVIDYTMSPDLERSLAKAMDQINSDTGFTAQAHRLDLVGVCSKCS